MVTVCWKYLQDGFGFLRSADSSYLAGPDDIYVSPSQIRRFNLRTGDTVAGKNQAAKRWRTLLRLIKKYQKSILINPTIPKTKFFLKTLHSTFSPTTDWHLEVGNGSSEDLSARVIDLTAPIGKGQRGSDCLSSESRQNLNSTEHCAKSISS